MMLYLQTIVALLPFLTLTSAGFTTLLTKNNNNRSTQISSHRDDDTIIARNTNRRAFLSTASTITASTILFQPPLLTPSPASAVAAEPDNTVAATPYTKPVKNIRYSFTPPLSFEPPSKKPLATHLDEVNFISKDTRGYQYGITVDPVRIESLSDFGNIDEVAQKVVAAESVRDGVFDVKLVSGVDRLEEGGNGGGYYAIDYISEGKRGTKHFCTRIFIKQKLLVVLTAQVKEADFNAKRGELFDTLDTFVVE